MGQRHISNEEVMEALKLVGFKPIDPFDTGNEQSWMDREGAVKKLKFQKRGEEQVKDGRHWIGITHDFLDKVDAFVFWAKGEKFLIVYPAGRLKEIFDLLEYDVKVVDSQWHVNLTFDRGGRQYFQPVYCEEREVSEFAFPIPKCI